MAKQPLKGMTKERAEQIVDLYDTGTSLDKIAEKFGIFRTRARDDYRAAIDAIYAETVQ